MSARALTPLLIAIVAAALLAIWAAGRPPGPAANPTPLAPDFAAPNEPFLARMAAKQEVAAAVLRGELTGADAADRFRELNGEAAVAHLRDMYPDAQADELAFRQVVHFVAFDPRPPTAVKAERLRALHAEFFARFPGAAPFPVQYCP